MLTNIYYPYAQAVHAWQYKAGQPLPSWAGKLFFLEDGTLILDRRSGSQVVYPGEWLVRDLDGGVVFYTDAEFRRKYYAPTRRCP